MAPAARERQPAADPVAPVDRPCLGLAGTPGKDRTRVASEDVMTGRGRQVGGNHGAAVTLTQTPCHAAVEPGCLFDGAEKHRRRDLQPVLFPRQQHPEQTRFEQRVVNRLREAPQPLALGRMARDQSAQPGNALDRAG